MATAGEEDDARGGVALVVVEVEEEAKGDDADELEEMDVEVVGLWAVGLPEERGGWRAQLRDGATGLGGGDGPGGEGADFAVVWGDGVVGVGRVGGSCCRRLIWMLLIVGDRPGQFWRCGVLG